MRTFVAIVIVALMVRAGGNCVDKYRSNGHMIYE